MSQSYARETYKSGRNCMEILTGETQDAVSVDVERTDLLREWEKRTSGKNSDGKAHGCGTECSVGWRRKNGLIDRMGGKIYL